MTVPAKLDQKVRSLLRKTKGNWTTVAVKSGVSYSWISKFMNGHITNPGIGTLSKIKAALEAK